MENMKEQIGEILVQVKREIEAHLESTSLISEGFLDSLDIMNLIMALEDTFEVEVAPEDVLAENFESIEAMMGLIQKYRG